MRYVHADLRSHISVENLVLPLSFSGFIFSIVRKSGEKAAWLGLVVTFLFSLNFSRELQAQPIEIPAQCYDDPCPTIQWSDFGMYFIHPMFPNCIIEALCRYKQCPNGKIYHEITQVEFMPTITDDCTQLKNWINADRTRIGQIYDLALQSLATELFKWAKFNGATVLCPNQTTSYTTYQVPCNTFCFYEDYVLAKLIVIPKKCNSSGCCMIEENMCWDEATQKIITTKTVTIIGTLPGTCTPSSTPCAPYITRKNLTGNGTHQVPLDEAVDCVPNSCQPPQN